MKFHRCDDQTSVKAGLRQKARPASRVLKRAGGKLKRLTAVAAPAAARALAARAGPGQVRTYPRWRIPNHFGQTRDRQGSPWAK